MTKTAPPAVDTVTTAWRDAAYVGIGLGVIAFQQAQVRRQELTRAATARLGNGRGSLDTLGGAVEDRVKLIEERLEEAEARVGALLDDVTARLPEQAQDVVTTARKAARDARSQVRELVTRAS